MERMERYLARLRTNARAASSEVGGPDGGGALPPLRDSPSSRRREAEDRGPLDAAGRVSRRLPASYLILPAGPSDGFASPFRVPPDVAERWFRPAPPRSLADPFEA